MVAQTSRQTNRRLTTPIATIGTHPFIFVSRRLHHGSGNGLAHHPLNDLLAVAIRHQRSIDTCLDFQECSSLSSHTIDQRCDSLDMAPMILGIYSFHAREFSGDGVSIDHLQEELDL